jgi:hypothetical protein
LKLVRNNPAKSIPSTSSLKKGTLNLGGYQKTAVMESSRS